MPPTLKEKKEGPHKLFEMMSPMLWQPLCCSNTALVCRLEPGAASASKEGVHLPELCQRSAGSWSQSTALMLNYVRVGTGWNDRGISFNDLLACLNEQVVGYFNCSSGHCRPLATSPVDYCISDLYLTNKEQKAAVYVSLCFRQAVCVCPCLSDVLSTAQLTLSSCT